MSESDNDVYEPSSPLILALLSVLTLSPRHDEPYPGQQDLDTRKAVASSLAQRARDAVDSLCKQTNTSSTSTWVSNFHPHVPQAFELPLSCCVLCIYQYLHCGNIAEMTFLAEKAFDLIAGLVSEAPSRSDAYDEAARRTWWMAVSSRAFVPTVVWLTGGLYSMFACVTRPLSAAR